MVVSIFSNLFLDFNYRWIFTIFFKFNLMGKEIDILSRRIRFLFNDDYILGSYLSRFFPIFSRLDFFNS